MASQAPVVPSKNALRALRRLALSPPTIVIGTLGSVCGVVTLHHETRRRVHLAEQIVETKRILQSVSSGTAAARLNDMFEAAEKGEDFTIRAQHAKKRRKSNGSRPFSTAAMPEPIENKSPNNADRLPSTNRRTRSSREPHILSQAIQRPLAMEKAEVQDIDDVVKKIIAASKQTHKPPGHSVYGRPSQLGQIAGNLPGTVRRRPKETQQALDGVSRRKASTWGFLRRVVTEDVSGNNGVLQTKSSSALPNARKAVLRSFHSGHAAALEEPLKRPAIPLSYARFEIAASPGKAYYFHHSTVFQTPQNHKDSSVQPPPRSSTNDRSDGESAQRSDTESDAPSAGPGGNAQQNSPGYFSWRPFGIITNTPRVRRWHHVRFASLLSGESSQDLKSYMGQADIQQFQADSEKWPSLCVADFVARGIDEETDQELKIHLQSTRNIGGDPNLHGVFDGNKMVPHYIVEYLSKAVNPKSFIAVKTFISPPDEALTYEETLRRWLAVMRYYTQGDEQHWAMAEAAFHSFRFQFEPEDIFSPPVVELVKNLLATARTSDRVQEILFPSIVPEGFDAVIFYNLPFQYMSTFCETHDDTACVEELAKIQFIAKRTRYEPRLNLFTPYIRKRLRQNDTEDATTLSDVLQPLCGTDSEPRIWAECALWHASQGNWDDVQEILDLIHLTGYPRRRPGHYALLFHKLLLRYLANSNAVHSFGFLINGIKFAGLQPLHMISTTLICACVKERRFDLVAEWTSMIREAFPRVSLTFKTERKAWHLGRALLESGASCQDIADVCRAISFGRREDPFCHMFKDFVRELVRLDLVHRMCAIPAQMQDSNVSNDTVRAMTLPEILDYACQFCNTQRSASEIDTRYETIRDGLAAQIAAFDELMSIFEGDFELNNFSSRGSPEQSGSPWPGSNGESVKRPTVTTGFGQQPLQWAELPDYPELVKIVADHYALRKKANLPVDHALLKRLLVELPITRPLDALKLVETVYASHYVQGHEGKPFDNGTFVKWLELVVEAGNVLSATKALWAVIDSSRHLVWTFDFATLVHLAGTAHVEKSKLYTKEWHPDQDLRHLTKRILCIRQDSPDYVKDDFCFPRWRDWEEKLRWRFRQMPHNEQEMSDVSDMATTRTVEHGVLDV